MVGRRYGPYRRRVAAAVWHDWAERVERGHHYGLDNVSYTGGAPEVHCVFWGSLRDKLGAARCCTACEQVGASLNGRACRCRAFTGWLWCGACLTRAFEQPVPRGHTALLYLYQGELAVGGSGPSRGTAVQAPRLVILDDGDLVRTHAVGAPARFLLPLGTAAT